MTLKTYLIIIICDLIFIPSCMVWYAKNGGRAWYYPYVFITNGLGMLFITLQYIGVV